MIELPDLFDHGIHGPHGRINALELTEFKPVARFCVFSAFRGLKSSVDGNEKGEWR